MFISNSEHAFGSLSDLRDDKNSKRNGKIYRSRNAIIIWLFYDDKCFDEVSIHQALHKQDRREKLFPLQMPLRLQIFATWNIIKLNFLSEEKLKERPLNTKSLNSTQNISVFHSENVVFVGNSTFATPRVMQIFSVSF